MSERYPIKLENPRQTKQGPITHARAFHGVEGWELWGEVSGGGEIHLDTKYYRSSPEMPEEWQVKVNYKPINHRPSFAKYDQEFDAWFKEVGEVYKEATGFSHKDIEGADWYGIFDCGMNPQAAIDFLFEPDGTAQVESQKCASFPSDAE